jgi:hypothetical protein
MSVRLLAFGELAHNPECVLAAVQPFAHVDVKLYRNVRFSSIGKAGLELSIAAFADSYGWERGALHDPQFAFRHDSSLAHLAGVA